MNTDIKERWVAALRSGEYKQASGYLKADDGFCCLGVLCDLAAQDGLGEWAYRDDEDVIEFRATTGDCSVAALPRFIQDWAGLDSDLGEFVAADDEPDNLAAVNDNGATFERIAEIIEERF